MASAKRDHITGVWDEVEGQMAIMGLAALADSFLSIFIVFHAEEGPTVKDLSDVYSPGVRGRLLLAAMISPYFWSVGEGGRLVLEAGSATVLIYSTILLTNLRDKREENYEIAMRNEI